MTKKKGFTMIELMVAVVVVGIISVALVCQYFSEQTFRMMINNQVAATNDASVAMHHMTRVLRYAINATISTTAESGYVTSIKATINHDVAGASLPEFTSNTTVVYGRKSDNTFEYKMGSSDPYIISDCITDFPVDWLWWDWLTGCLTLEITAQKGTRSSSLRTRVQVVGG